MNRDPKTITLENAGDRFCDQCCGGSVFNGQDFQFTHDSLRKTPSGSDHLHSIARPDPVFPSPVQVHDIPLRHEVHCPHIGLEVHNSSFRIADGRLANCCFLVSRKYEPHHRVTRRNSCVGPNDLDSGQLLVDLAHLDHCEPINQMTEVLAGDWMEYLVRTSVYCEKIS